MIARKYMVLGTDGSVILTDKTGIECIEKVDEYTIKLMFKSGLTVNVGYCSREEMIRGLKALTEWIYDDS